MTYEQAKEIIEYFNINVLPRIPKGVVEKITPVPLNQEEQDDFKSSYCLNNYDDSLVDSIKNDNLSVGIYYYETGEVPVYFAPLTEKWLNRYGINNFPEFFRNLLQSLS